LPIAPLGGLRLTRVTGPRRDPYAILGVPRGAGRDEVASAFRRLAKRTHPDVGGQAPSEMQDLNWAWNLLSNPARRADWDRSHATPGMAGNHWSAGGNPVSPPPPGAAEWRSPPPWTVSGEPWAGAGAPVVAQRTGIGCVGLLFAALVMAAFIMFGALTSRFPASVDEPATESEAQSTQPAR
jgi:curved DNA-binding protein CbpA